jgi:hypothetical protein
MVMLASRVPARPTQNQLPQAGVAIEPHDDELTSAIHGARQDDAADIAVSGDVSLHGHLDCMATEPGRDIRPDSAPWPEPEI